MLIYGYARVSTLDPDLAIPRVPLEAAGCGVIRGEKASGGRTGNGIYRSRKSTIDAPDYAPPARLGEARPCRHCRLPA